MHTPMAHQRISKTTNLTAESVEDTILFAKLPNGKSPALDVDYVDTWKEMEKLVRDGRVKSLGVSNFNSQQLDRLNRMATIKPTANQVECHANFNQRKLIKFSKERNILTICYSPLGRPHASGDKKLAINDPIVLELGKKYRKTPAQIVLRSSVCNVFEFDEFYSLKSFLFFLFHNFSIKMELSLFQKVIRNIAFKKILIYSISI